MLKDIPASARPREKLLALGPQSLADAELIALLLRTGLKGTSVLQLAEKLLDAFGGLTGLLRAEPEQLKRQLHGLDNAALHFRAAPDEWSIMEIVGHIIDVGTLWPGRTRQMLATDNPTLAAVDPAWVRQRDYHN